MIHLHFLSSENGKHNPQLGSFLLSRSTCPRAVMARRAGVWMGGKRIAKLDFHIKTGIKINSGGGERN
jgi:hypothetical protein